MSFTFHKYTAPLLNTSINFLKCTTRVNHTDKNWVIITNVESLYWEMIPWQPQMFLKMSVWTCGSKNNSLKSFSLYSSVTSKVRSWECFLWSTHWFLMPTAVLPSTSKASLSLSGMCEAADFSQRLLLTRVMVSGWLKSLPPESRNPQGAGPSSTTFCGISVLFCSASSFSKLNLLPQNSLLLLARDVQ